MTPKLLEPASRPPVSDDGAALVSHKRLWTQRLMLITIKDDDRGIEMSLMVEPYFDDLGRYVQPNRVWLLSGLVSFGDCLEPLNVMHNGRSSGLWIEEKYRAEIDEQVRAEIERRHASREDA